MKKKLWLVLLIGLSISLSIPLTLSAHATNDDVYSEVQDEAGQVETTQDEDNPNEVAKIEQDKPTAKVSTITTKFMLNGYQSVATLTIVDSQNQTFYEGIYSSYGSTVYLPIDSYKIYVSVFYSPSGNNKYYKLSGDLKANTDGTLETSNWKIISSKGNGTAITATIDEKTVNITAPTSTSSHMVSTGYMNKITSTPNLSTGVNVEVRDSDGILFPYSAKASDQLTYEFPQETASYTYKATSSSYKNATGSINVSGYDATFVADKAEELTLVSSGIMQHVNLNLMKSQVKITTDLKPTNASFILKDSAGQDVEKDSEGNYVVDFSSITTTELYSYTLKSQNFMTINGQLEVTSDGKITDKSDINLNQKNTVNYEFNSDNSEFKVRMLPYVEIIPGDFGTATIDASEMFKYFFGDNLYENIKPGDVASGSMVVHNPHNNYEYVITDYDFLNGNTTTPSLSTMLRARNEAMIYLYYPSGNGTVTFKQSRDVEKKIQAVYGSQGITTYYDYLVHYFKANLAGKAEYQQYSSITSLDELKPEHLSLIFDDSNITFRDTMPSEWDADPGDENADNVLKFGPNEYALLETDTKLDQLGKTLFFDYGSYFTFDSSIHSVGHISSTNNPGLSVGSYTNKSDANQSAVKDMFQNIAFAPQSDYKFNNIGFSIAGDYIGNAYQRRNFNLGMTLKLNLSVVGLDGIVYHDANKNGILDQNETYYANVEVSLVNSQGAVVATTQTDSNGYYMFPGISADDYTLKIDLPSGKKVVNIVADPNLEANREHNVFKADGTTEAIHVDAHKSYRANAGLVDIVYSSYTVEYYKDTLGTPSDAQYLGSMSGTTSFEAGHSLTLEEIVNDLGADWLNTNLPTDYQNGVTSDLPFVIQEDATKNVIKVLYINQATVTPLPEEPTDPGETTPTNPTKPTTGDSGYGLLVAMAVVSLSAIVYIQKKKFTKKEH